MDGFINFADLRSYPRDPIEIKTCIRSQGKEVFGKTTDVSLTGIGLCVPDLHLAPGEKIEIQVVSGSLGSSWHPAYVRWSDNGRVGCEMHL